MKQSKAKQNKGKSGSSKKNTRTGENLLILHLCDSDVSSAELIKLNLLSKQKLTENILWKKEQENREEKEEIRTKKFDQIELKDLRKIQRFESFVGAVEQK